MIIDIKKESNYVESCIMKVEPGQIFYFWHSCVPRLRTQKGYVTMSEPFMHFELTNLDKYQKPVTVKHHRITLE